MDLRYALRLMRRQPGFSLAAILLLALGVGSNVAMFSIVNAVVLRPLAFNDSERIVTLWSLNTRTGRQFQVSGPDFGDWREQSRSFEAMAYYAAGRTSVIAGGQAEAANVASATDDFFSILGVQPLMGRFPTGGEAGAEGAAAVSHRFWRERLGGDDAVLGRKLQIFGKVFSITSVVPPGLGFPADVDVWYPADPAAIYALHRTAHNFRVIARLKPDVGLTKAQEEMKSVAARIATAHPENSTKSAVVVPLRESLITNVRPTMFALLACVGVVLLIACANIANLLLARAAGRTREVALRAAVGASPARILKQLLTESLVLAGIGGATGLLIAVATLRGLVAFVPAGVPRIEEIGLDWRVLLFALAISALASLIFGVAPAVKASRTDLNEALKQGGRTVGSRGSHRVISGIVVAEIALSLTLLASAGLLLRSLMKLGAVDTGMRADGVTVMDTEYPASGMEASRKAVSFYERLLENAADLPGVEAVAAVSALPTQPRSNGRYTIEGRPAPAAGDLVTQQAGFILVSPGFFRVLGIPLRTGRDFDMRDREGGQFTCIVNEALVRASFPGEDPIGRRIQTGYDRPEFMTIVGVVRDTRHDAIDRAAGPQIYMPYGQHPMPASRMAVLVRSSSPATVAPALRQIARGIESSATHRLTTLEQVIAGSTATARFRGTLFAIFAGLALLLAAIGLYGLLSYLVRQRTAEIGIRVALGARPRDVSAMVTGDAMRLVGLGAVAGLAGVFVAGRMLSKMLFEVTPLDPWTYAAVTLVLFTAALAAAYLPARRAASVDPLHALRQE